MTSKRLQFIPHLLNHHTHLYFTKAWWLAFDLWHSYLGKSIPHFICLTLESNPRHEFIWKITISHYWSGEGVTHFYAAALATSPSTVEKPFKWMSMCRSCWEGEPVRWAGAASLYNWSIYIRRIKQLTRPSGSESLGGQGPCHRVIAHSKLITSFNTSPHLAVAGDTTK